MFEPVKSWSLPDHLYMVSAWSAKCKDQNPKSCLNNIGGPDKGKLIGQAVNQELTTGTTSIDLAWTDITSLLHAHHVSWRYYVQRGAQPDCASAAALACSPVQQRASTPGIWNPLPLFEDVQQDHQVGNQQNWSSPGPARLTGPVIPIIITPHRPHGRVALVALATDVIREVHA